MNLLVQVWKWFTKVWQGKRKDDATKELTFEEAWASLQEEIKEGRKHPEDLDLYFMQPEKLSDETRQEIQLHVANCPRCLETKAYYEKHEEMFRLRKDPCD